MIQTSERESAIVAQGSATNEEVVVTFEECKVEGAEAKCTVEGVGRTAGTIETDQLKSELV